MSDQNQHWVPKFLIKNFADHDGRVFCLEVHTDRVTVNRRWIGTPYRHPKGTPLNGEFGR